MSHLGASTVGSPGFNRRLSASGKVQRYTNLAIGTHVFEVHGTSDLHFMVTSTGGTVNIDYTFDQPPADGDYTTGVAAPAQVFAAGIQHKTWTPGATADAVDRILGPVTAIEVTIAAAAVNEITIAAHGRRHTGG